MWYSEYSESYDKDWRTLPKMVLEELKEDIARVNAEASPLASVVAIAHNEEKHLVSCLQSLVKNIASFPFEILVINNNSTDSTEELLQFLGVKYFNETKKGPGHARNCGLDHASGRYYICADSDTVYPPTYVQTMVRALEDESVACAFGLWSFFPDKGHTPTQLWLYEGIRDIYLRIQQIKRPELNVRGMVFAFRTEMGRKYRFRTDIIRGEDGSLALCMKNDGKLKLLTTKKVRPVTGHGTVGQDGGMLGMFMVRAKKALTSLTHLVTKQDKYEDEESNLIK